MRKPGPGGRAFLLGAPHGRSPRENWAQPDQRDGQQAEILGGAESVVAPTPGIDWAAPGTILAPAKS